MRCPECGGYSFDSDGNCLNPNCPGYNMNRTKPRQELGKVDIFKLAHGLDIQKRKQEGLVIPRLSDCLHCHQHSLHYDLKEDTFTCVNPECAIFNKPILFNTRDFNIIVDKFRNAS
jgi:hypothetical protein